MSTPATSEPAAGLAAIGRVEVPPAYEVVADRLRRAIHVGLLSDGERLPSERDLAELLGVSRVTVREALRTLQGAGYITRRRGAAHGTMVATPLVDAATLRVSLLERLPEIREVSDFRAIVEAAAAEAAAGRHDELAVAALDGAVAALDEVETVGEFRRSDALFHLQIAHMAGNRMLEGAIVDAREQMFAPIDALPYRLMVDRSRRDHAAIRDAIVAGRGKRAAALMARHVRASYDELRSAVDAA